MNVPTTIEAVIILVLILLEVSRVQNQAQKQHPTRDPRRPRVKPDTGKRAFQPTGTVTRLPRPTYGATAVRVEDMIQAQQSAKARNE